MNQNELTRFFDEILAEPQEGQDGNVLASRAALASVLLGENSLESDDAGGTTNRAASDIYDLDAAQCFVDRVSSGILPVPPGLITAVVQDNVPSSRKTSVAISHRNIPRWGWAATAMAAVLVLTLFATTRPGEQRATFVANVAPAAAVSSLQTPGKSNVDLVPPQSPAPESKPAKVPEPVYTTPNPPLALTSHAVTVDDYPAASIRLQEEGAVQIKYTIDTDGTVSDCIVTITSGFPRLDQAACILVKKWTFKPATVIGGAAVAFIMPAAVVFRLAPAPSTAVQSGKSGVLIEGKDFNAVGVPVSPPSTPPLALTSHAVNTNDYPPVSIQTQEQGKVQVKYAIGPDGRVSDCAVTMSSGKPRLDDAACVMVKKNWKFAPATQNGKPVAVTLPAEIIFALK